MLRRRVCLQSIKDLFFVFNDPDSGSTFSVWDRNMESRRGRGNGWFVVGVSADNPDDESCLAGNVFF